MKKQIEFFWCEKEDRQFDEARQLRWRVFVEEQGFTAAEEFDALDAKSRHVLMYNEGLPVGTARIFFDEQGVLHVGRLAMAEPCRGKGLGLLMMEEIHKKARELGAVHLVLNAQADKTGFYQKAGYAVVGDVFLEDGYPHLEMRRTLEQ